jgi:predicted component of type VI protein secretion system
LPAHVDQRNRLRGESSRNHHGHSRAELRGSRLLPTCPLCSVSSELWALTMIIKIQLKESPLGRDQAFEFDQSPIRIGRNPLNNIVIEDGFVSQWHGMIRFDDTSISYIDLGSTNGTLLDGTRVPKNVPVPLMGVAQLRIWGYLLVVTLGQALPGEPRRSTTQVIGGSAGPPSRPAPPPPAAADPSSTANAATNAALLARYSRILECFSDSFVALKRGYEEFGDEVGVRPISGSTPLHHVRTGREVMNHLIDPGKNMEESLGDLKAVFADMGIHQLALMEGITQGIRALLESLDPSVQEKPGGSGLFSRSRSKAQWQMYCERFATLISEDVVLHGEIFGEAFARAYASVALGSHEGGR